MTLCKWNLGNKMSNLLRLVACLCIFVSSTSLGVTTTINWSGTLAQVIVDVGGTYSGDAAGQRYTGIFEYGDVQESFDLTSGVYYMHQSSLSTLTNSTIERSSSSSEIAVYDGWECSTSSRPVLWGCESYSNVFDKPVAEVSQLDSWWLDSGVGQDGSVLRYAIDFASTDSAFLSDASYQAIPPFGIDENNPDLTAVFWVVETDINNELVYGAWGYIDQLTITQDPPTGTPAVITGLLNANIEKGGSALGSLLATDLDGLTDGTYFTVSNLPVHGQALINPTTGLWTYLADVIYAGADYFTVTVTDDLGGTTEQIITINIVGIDTDSDTIYDFLDNCPSTSNTNQSNIDGDLLGDVCDPDIDGDGTDNAFDAFPNDATESADNDADNIGDNSDNCINDANADQANLDGDALGDACDSDMDGDGVANVVELRFGGDETDNTDASVSQNNIVTFSETAPADSDLDGVPDDVEAMLGEDNTSSTFQDLLDTLSTIATAKNVPAMGGIGLLALGLSMLGLGAVRLRGSNNEERIYYEKTMRDSSYIIL